MHNTGNRRVVSALSLGLLTFAAIGCIRPQLAYAHDMCSGSSSPAPSMPAAPVSQPVAAPPMQPTMPAGPVGGPNPNLTGVGTDLTRVMPRDPYAPLPKTGIAPIDAAVTNVNAINARNKHVENEVNSIIDSMDGPPPVAKPDGNLVPPSEWKAAFEKKIAELTAQQQQETGTLKALQSLKASGKVDAKLVDSQIKAQLEKLGATTKQLVEEQGRFTTFKSRHGM